jgi:hypothetical protein
MENNDERIPRNAEIWLRNRRITMSQFPVSNLAWNARINLMMKGEGGDPNYTIERRKLQWQEFTHLEGLYNKTKVYNIWNREVLMLNKTLRIVKLEEYDDLFGKQASVLIEDYNRLRIVTDECLQLIDHIGNKIRNINSIKYVNEEKEEEWEHKQFGNNEYQDDLLFIRNSSRIKLIFNVIKKQNPDIMKKRCKLAKEAMKYNPNVIILEEDEPECLPDLYMKKRRWKVAKKYIRKFVPESRTAEITKLES